MPSPATISKSAGRQWFNLNNKPKPDNENENAPVMNANFFISIVFRIP